VFAAAWVALFSSGVLGLGVYRHVLKAPRLPTTIQIRITR
jgi:hypothetical protein